MLLALFALPAKADPITPTATPMVARLLSKHTHYVIRSDVYDRQRIRSGCASAPTRRQDVRAGEQGYLQESLPGHAAFVQRPAFFQLLAKLRSIASRRQLMQRGPG